MKHWLEDHFRVIYILTPIATRNLRINSSQYAHTGYTDVLVFGFRVARIQRTEPWK
jgi:hypothetical protein